MWSTVLSILGIKIPLWLFLIVFLAASGLFIVHKIEASKIDSLNTQVISLKKEKDELQEVVKDKEDKITILQKSVEDGNKALVDYQNRNTKLLKIINGFGSPVVIPATGKNELNAINKKDSSEFIDWLNEEIWK